jgi:predicted MFS family arabinose efflux permease
MHDVRHHQRRRRMQRTTRAIEPPAGPPVGRHRANFRGWWCVAALQVTQTVGYGVLYYSFAVVLEPMATELNASTAAVTGALTCSILAGAVVAVPVGRWLDRHGGRALMTGGSLLATVLVVAWSRVENLVQLYAVLVGIGVTSGMVLYDAAFAVVVAWFDPATRARAILAVTVVGGFSSTIFMPLTGTFVDAYGWRTALLILAAIHGVITVPLHALALRRAPHQAKAIGPAPDDRDRGRAVRAALRDQRFWWLAVAFVVHGAAMSAITVHLVGYLVHKGHPATFAASIAGLLGVLSVTGRLTITGIQRRLPTAAVVAIVFIIQALGALGLLAYGGDRIGAALAVTAFGIGFGVASLVKPTMLADRYGTTAFATIAGILAAPITLAKALAPLAAAGLLTAGGYPLVLATIAAGCLTAAIAVVARASSPAPADQLVDPAAATS